MSTFVPLVTACHVPTNLVYSRLSHQIDAALHHGGAGKTGASLRGTVSYLHWVFSWTDDDQNRTAGIPNSIRPWFWQDPSAR